MERFTAIAILDGLYDAGSLSDWEYQRAIRMVDEHPVRYGQGAPIDIDAIIRAARS